MICWVNWQDRDWWRSSMPGRWGKFWSLGRDERRWFLAALIGLPVTRLGLRLMDFRRMQRLMIKPERGQRQPPNPNQVATGQRIGQMVNRAAGQQAWQITCVERSLLTGWLLKRRGIDSEVIFGVSITGGIFPAHAWVEVLGTVINDTPDVRDRFGVLEATTPPG